jgi:sugar lactone lactonase YvrE
VLIDVENFMPLQLINKLIVLTIGSALFLSASLLFSSSAQQSGFRIKQRNPVVNEGNRINLTAVDLNGKPINSITWESGSPDIAQVDPNSGEVRGIKQGFATVTARQGNDSSSVFVAVARVAKGKGEKVPGDTKLDSGGRLYISNPSQNIILRAEKALNSPMEVFAGQRKVSGRRNGERHDALFAGPTAIAINNSAQGGIFVADTLNHSIRKIGFNNQVETILGTGSPGLSFFDNSGMRSFDGMNFQSPRGIEADAGGNLFIADTENHSIYYVDFSRQRMVLLAGEPGESGKEDGPGRQSRFKRPSGMALSSDGRVLTVADEDNNRVRLIEITRGSNGEPVGNVSTLGTASVAQNLSASGITAIDQEAVGEIEFDRPQSIALDGVGNIYVVDRTGVQVVTRPTGQNLQVIQLAQPEVSFNQAVSIVVRGNESFVLDANAPTEEEAIKIVTIGGPEIKKVTPSTVPLEGGAEIVVTGSNFAPESMVVFGDTVLQNTVVASATEIRFTVPPQASPGVRTLTIMTRGGVAQKELGIIAKPVSELREGEITTIAGGTAFFGDGGLATSASISTEKILVDKNGNLFIADLSGQRVREVNSETGIITTVAGGGNTVQDRVPANVAFLLPSCIAIDGSGNLLIGDAFTQSIRRVDALSRIITTVAGGERIDFSGDGGPATKAGFGDMPREIVIDSEGNLFILAAGRVRRVDAKTGIIKTVAGNGKVEFNGDGGPAVEASLNRANSITLDAAGNLLISDTGNNRIRRVDSKSGIITTVAGNGIFDFTRPSINGKQATEVSIGLPRTTVVDSEGNLLVLGVGVLIRIEAGTNIVNLVPLSDPKDLLGNLILTGGLATDGVGNIFVTSLYSVKRTNGKTFDLTTVAGNGLVNFLGDGVLAVSASLGFVNKVVSDDAGNIFIGDAFNNYVRKIDGKTGIITTVAGDGPRIIYQAAEGDGGQATKAVVVPDSIAIDSHSNLFILDSIFGNIRRVDSRTGIIKQFAGTGKSKVNGDGRSAKKASLGEPFDIVFDRSNNLFVSGSNLIRRIDGSTKIITTIAGTGNPGPSSDGQSATTARISPERFTIDSSGNIFFVEKNRVRKIDAATGIVTTLAGNGQRAYSGEGGPAVNAGLGDVVSIAVDSAGNLFIGASMLSDFNVTPDIWRIPRVWRVNARTGIITKFLGSNNNEYSGDGGPVSEASLAGIPVLNIDKAGNLLIGSTEIPRVGAIRLVKLGR